MVPQNCASRVGILDQIVNGISNLVLAYEIVTSSQDARSNTWAARLPRTEPSVRSAKPGCRRVLQTVRLRMRPI